MLRFARSLIFALAVTSIAGCTLRRVAVDAGCSDQCSDDDAGHDAIDAGDRRDAALDASLPRDAARDGNVPADARIDAQVDAEVPREDAGPTACHPLAPACDATLPDIPLAGTWAGYWEADVGVETSPATGPDGTYLGVARWRSRVGDAVLEYPRDIGVTFPEATVPPRAPRYQLDGWGRVGDTCPSADCLPSLRFERAAGTASSSGDGAVLVSRDPSMLSVVGDDRRTATIVMQVEIAPDPDRRTITLFSWGPSSGTFPYLRGYVSGTTFREQSQDALGGTAVRVDFAARAERAQPAFIAYVIDLDAAEPVALYTALGTAEPERSTVTSSAALSMPGDTIATLTIGALGRGAVSDAFDGSVRRFAISDEALAIEQLTTLADAWRAEDASRTTDASTRYLGAIAASDPILFTRLASALPGPDLPLDASVHGSSNVSIGACSTSFTAPGGMGGYIEIPDDDAYSIVTSGEGLSVEVWMRVDDPNPLGEPGPDGPREYIHFLGKADSEQYEWAFRAYRADAIDRPGRLSFYSWPLSGGLAPGQYVEPSCEADPGRWIHLVGVADDPSRLGGGVRFYVDGRPGGGTANRYDASTTPANGTAPLRLGIRNPSSTGESGGYLVGALADFAIYPRVLTDTEIAAHYAAASGTRY